MAVVCPLPPWTTTTTAASTVKDYQATDEYGRKIRDSVQGRPSDSFHATIPDNPFGVTTVYFETLHNSNQTVLQFWTWHAEFYVLRSNEKTEAGEARRADPGEGLVRCDIADENADWCGHILLNEDWMNEERDGQKWHFIAL
ncbi:hypothetical protein VM1G_03533 [Cytospora mali]|uniref:Uncharacterized protein n=1 Tax=Cytospora mali TaxID=578113 RepID=A0A194VUB3_CYTMA|nr:hypothetical protein VM1G_03533 [Valsa mali]